MFAKQFYWSKLSWASFKLGRSGAFQLSPDRFPFSYWVHIDWLAPGGLMGGRESYHFRGNQNSGPGCLTWCLPWQPHIPPCLVVSMKGPIMGLLYHLWGQSNIEIWVTLGGRTGSVFSLTIPPWETSYSRWFLGIGVKVSFFCNFFLLCLGIGLPSRAEVSLYVT